MSGIMNPKFLGGVAVGVLAPNVIPYQDAIVTAVAVLPVPKMGMGGICRGYVIGRLGKHFVPALGNISSGMFSGSTAGSGGTDLI